MGSPKVAQVASYAVTINGLSLFSQREEVGVNSKAGRSRMDLPIPCTLSGSGILAECREKARTIAAEGKPFNRVAAAVVVIALWISLATLAAWLVAWW